MELLMGLSIFGFLFFLVWWYNGATSRKAEREHEIKLQTYRELKKVGKMAFKLIFNGTDYIAIIDNFFYIKIGKGTGKVDIKDMLKVEIKYHVKERNRMRLMTVMPTFDKYTRLIGIELIIYTRNGTDIDVVLDPNIIKDQSIKKLKIILDEKIKEEKLIDKSE